MAIYLDFVIILNFLVDFLLLLGTNRLSGYPPGAIRAAAAASVGGAYGGICLLPGFAFLGNVLWRMVSLGLISWIAFGSSFASFRRGILFALLSMALGGAALGFSGGGFFAIVAAAGCVCLLCGLGFSGQVGSRRFVPVELTYRQNKVRLLALRDTGNTLRDPITGQGVLIVGADIAQKLTELTPEQLRNPTRTMAEIPGFRLIPYRAVGNDGSLLLALRIPEAMVGDKKGSALVAFAPEKLSNDGAYQGLTGGVV